MHKWDQWWNIHWKMNKLWTKHLFNTFSITGLLHQRQHSVYDISYTCNSKILRKQKNQHTYSSKFSSSPSAIILSFIAWAGTPCKTEMRFLSFSFTCDWTYPNTAATNTNKWGPDDFIMIILAPDHCSFRGAPSSKKITKKKKKKIKFVHLTQSDLGVHIYVSQTGPQVIHNKLDKTFHFMLKHFFKPFSNQNWMQFSKVSKMTKL